MAAEVVSLYGRLELDVGPYSAALTRAENITGRFERVGSNRLGAFSVATNAHLARVAGQTKLTAAELQKLNSISLSRIGGSVSSLATGIRGLAATAGIGLGISSLKKYVDAAKQVENQLRVAGLSGEDMTQVFGKLFDSAQRYAVPLGSLSQLYGQVALSQKELGVSTNDLLRFTDRVSLALTVAGTNAQTASGALLQLSQAMGSGVVRSQEFNSILSGVPTIAQAAAAGIEEAGGSVGKLRELVNDGKVSSRAFFEGFLAGSVQLESKAASTAVTVEQAFTRIQNTMTVTVGRYDAVLKASDSAVSSLTKLASIIKIVGDHAESTAGLFNTFSAALEGTGKHAEGVYGWLSKIASLNPANNLSKFLVDKVASIDRTSPALPQSGIGEWGGVPDAPASANVPLPRSRPDAPIKTVSVNDFPAQSEKNAKALQNETDAFDRASFAIERRIALLKADITTMGMSGAARDKARIIAELEIAAIKTNTAAGLENTSVTDEQRAKINELADAFGNARSQIEAANGPLGQWVQQSQNISKNFESLMATNLDGLANSLSDIVDGTKTGAEAFSEMTKSILKDLQKMLIKMAAAAILKSIFSGLSGGGASSNYMMGSTSVPMFGGGGGDFLTELLGRFKFKDGGFVNVARAPRILALADGGHISGPGSSKSDSIMARLSNGEFVVNAEATKRNRALLEAMNSGFSLKMPGFAAGGGVGMATPAVPETCFGGEIGGVDVSIHYINRRRLRNHSDRRRVL